MGEGGGVHLEERRLARDRHHHHGSRRNGRANDGCTGEEDLPPGGPLGIDHRVLTCRKASPRVLSSLRLSDLGGRLHVLSQLDVKPVTKNGHTPSAKREDVISNSEVHLSKNWARSGVKKL